MKYKLSFKKIRNLLVIIYSITVFFISWGNASALTADKILLDPLSNLNDYITDSPKDDFIHSLNWSGYIAMKDTYTAVSGSWIIPQAEMSTSTSVEVTWVGIGGIKSDDLIQAGTQTLKNYNGKDVYHAWFELLPLEMQIIPVHVYPGHSVSVKINEITPDEWNIYFVNNSNGQSYSTVVNYKSSRSSAEWIQEMPTATSSGAFMPLSNFGVVQFTETFAKKQDGSIVNPKQADALSVTMFNSLHKIMALPSMLGDDNSSFSVARINN